MKTFKATKKHEAFDMIAAPVSGSFSTIAAAGRASLKWVATYDRGRYIVANEDGTYSSIPSAYMSDVSYKGSKDIVAKVMPS
jgi:hypothetical protein